MLLYNPQLYTVDAVLAHAMSSETNVCAEFSNREQVQFARINSANQASVFGVQPRVITDEVDYLTTLFFPVIDPSYFCTFPSEQTCSLIVLAHSTSFHHR